MTADMMSEAFVGLITADLYIVIAAVFGICFALKTAQFFDNRFIPLVAIALGVMLECVYAVCTGGLIIDFILKGIICGMAAVYVANIIKQIGSSKDESN